MRKLLLNIMLATATAVPLTQSANAEELPTLYGTMIYSDGWGTSAKYGVYSIDLGGGKPLKALKTGADFNANGGATYLDGKYVILQTPDEGQTLTYRLFDTSSWNLEEETEIDPGLMGLDFATDPTTGKLYGVCPDGQGTGAIELAIVDFKAKKKTSVGKLSQQLIAIAFNSTGKLYGITASGSLVSIDKATAALRNIGSTGLHPAYMQSATFDLATDRLYWAASLEEDGVASAAIYEVDTATGKATLVKELADSEEFVGLYCLNKAPDWTGPDHPAAPGNAAAQYTQEGLNVSATITWEAPVKGLHNGEIDPSALTYTVVRMPQGVTVADQTKALTATDSYTIEVGQTMSYYSITAYNGTLEGDAAFTDAYTHTGAIPLPYYEDFSDQRTFGAMKVLDGDGDGASWMFNPIEGYAYTGGSAYSTGNDFLLTPEFAMVPGRLYMVKGSFNSPYADSMYTLPVSAYIGQGEETSGYTLRVFDKSIMDHETYTLKGYGSIENAGNYRVGYRVSGYGTPPVMLDNLVVKAGPWFEAPAAPTDVTATAGAEGSLSATLSFTLPTTAVQAETLSPLTKANIYREDKLIATVDVPAGATAMTWTDNTPADRAVNHYAVALVNEHGEGLDTEVQVYVGLDTPKAPANVTLKASGDKYLLTWDAPTEGVNGGYIAPETIVYTVTNQYNHKSATTQATSYEEAEITKGAQDWEFYYVTAGNGQGTSEQAMSTTLVAGKPYDTPFYEGFPNGERTNFWGTTQVGDGYNSSGWMVTERADDADGNGGNMSFTHGMPGDRTYLFSGKIDLKDIPNPVLEFFYEYRAEEGDNPFNTYIIANGTDTTLVDSQKYVHYYEPKPFERVRVPLDQFKGSKYIQILFDGYTGDYYTLINLDAIGVRNWYAKDLKASLKSSHKTATDGDTVTLTARVENCGSETSEPYEVRFYDGDRLLGYKEGIILAPDSVADFELAVPVNTLDAKRRFRAEVAYSADEYLTNNTSTTTVVDVQLPVYPAPTGLKAMAAGSRAQLSWNEPDYTDFALPTTESAEGCKDLSADLGEWTTLDRDGANTRSNISIGWDSYETPGGTQPKGFIALNPAAHEIPATNWWDEPTGWGAQDGEQYFVSYVNEETTNDDWLISPQLSGDAQTITLWVSGSGYETFEVLVSDSGNDPDDFVAVGHGTAQAAWLQASLPLAEGTRYIALRHNSEPGSGSALRVDNIYYTPESGRGALRLKGYNIYYDRELIGTAPSTRYGFIFDGPADLTRLFHVTVLYDQGESSAAKANAQISALEDIDFDQLTETGRYTPDGLPVSATYRGIVIIRYSDGSTRKLIAK